jgi:hypothetical protein
MTDGVLSDIVSISVLTQINIYYCQPERMGGDGWKKLVCPLKLWRMELFKYMSVG